MATGGQFNWPPAGNFVAAYGQFFMAANRAAGTCPAHLGDLIRRLSAPAWGVARHSAVPK